MEASSSFTQVSFTVDTILPAVNISSVTSAQGSQTISFNHTASDINLRSCKYSVFNITNGIDGSLENVSVNYTTTPTPPEPIATQLSHLSLKNGRLSIKQGGIKIIWIRLI